MEIVPILSSLRRNKTGATLIGLQIALTLAIVCNALFIVQQHMQQMGRPSGLDEAHVFTLANRWVGKPQDLKPRIEEDLAAIRAVPGVVDADAANSFPLRGGGWVTGVRLKPDPKSQSALTTQYFVSEHGLAALGLKLSAGRWFAADEIGDLLPNQDSYNPASVIITQDLARALFLGTSALGQMVYLGGSSPARIVGIVERAQIPWATGPGQSFVEKSTFEPYRYISNDHLYYIVRTRAGQQGVAMKAVQDRLYALTRQRVIDQVFTFSETRSNAYVVPRSTSVLLAALCALLVAITIFGITGLTTYWVGQRRRQIGMRRALGARRTDILRYFHTENLLIAGGGVLLGIAFGLGGNLWLASHLELGRMSASYICVGAVMVLAISQASVFIPALRAASISPTEAIRGL
jgi:putative ABC transport system permease protein